MSVLLTVDIVGPFFDDPLGGPSAPVVPALLGGAILLGLLLLICIGLFSRGLCRLLLRGPWLLVSPEMVALAARVPALPLAPPVMVPSLPGLLLVPPARLALLRGLRGRCLLAGSSLLWLV